GHVAHEHPGARHLVHHQHGRRDPQAEAHAPRSDGHHRARAEAVHRAGTGRASTADVKRIATGMLILAMAVPAVAIDKPLIDLIQRNLTHFTDEFSRRVTPFGGHDALLISAAMFGTGWLTHDTRLRAAGLESVEAQVIAAGIVTPLLKR